MKWFAALIATGLLASTPSVADEFCDVLLHVTDDAPAKFEHIRGKPAASLTPRYDHALSLPGTQEPCWVVKNRLSYGYGCSFIDERNGHHAAARRIKACLSAAKVDFHAVPLRTDDGIETFRIATERAQIAVDIDIPNDGGDVLLYVLVDQKPA